ncbi:MAG TPA: zinc metalloprotease HtpX [Candidatus Limnocylindrales bacterium]|nr:zinc metalloprotease HtpX [Candidatus Limnocylindrales bacterium]
MNTIKTVGLLTILTLLLVFGARLFFGTGAIPIALGIAAVMNFGSWWFSDKIALSFAGAKPVTEAEAPELYRIVGRVAQIAELPTPRLYVIDQPAPNAFATGRDPQHAVVAVTRGILEVVNERELTAVLAHELGHVRNRDTFVMAVVASIAGAISYLAQMAQWSMWFGGGDRDDRDSGQLGMIGMILGIILLPMAAMLVQLAVSRSREYGADDQSAALTHDPLGLASALRKLEAYGKKVPLPVNPAVAPLFIVQPLLPGGLTGLFSTHPPIAERVARLERMAGAELPQPF